MKDLVKRLSKNNLMFQIAFLTALTMIISSCEKDALAPESDNAALKKGRAMSAAAPALSDLSIAAIAIDEGFSELVEALSFVDRELDTGLVDLFLNGTDQYTVFAPTNEAFENLYEALGVGDISELDPELVLDVLFYHVTKGRRASNSVVPPREKGRSKHCWAKHLM